MGLLSEDELRERIERLAAIERPSASPGEAEAARLIADELRALGAEVSVEEEPAHGTYWWPVGLPNAVAAAAGFGRGRLAGVVAGALAAAAVADDITGGSQWFRRHLLPQRITTNVIAEMGTRDAERTVAFMAHHDAAHAGLVFHPEIPRSFGRRFPEVLEKANTTPPSMWGSVGGPALVALGSLLGSRRLRRLGAGVSAGYVAAMADIGLREVVPGANDNLTAVAVLLSLAHWLADEPDPGVRVLLLSTGSEESFMEGMQGFARRHFAELPTDRTHFVCLDTVGSPHLMVLEGEGMLWMNEYPKDFIAMVKECADELGVWTWPDLRFRNATDGLLALRAGYPTVMIGSCDEFKAPTNYHWPTDTPDNLTFRTVADCAEICRAVALRLARAPVAAPA